VTRYRHYFIAAKFPRAKIFALQNSYILVGAILLKMPDLMDVLNPRPAIVNPAWIKDFIGPVCQFLHVALLRSISNQRRVLG
jgi:hypothetical protein